MLHTSELHIGTRHRVVARDDCRIEERQKSWMQKIYKSGYRGAQPFNLLSIDCVDPGYDFFRSFAAGAMVKKSAKGSLIVGVLVDVGDSEFGLPQECMIRTFENLSLLGDRMNNDLQ